MHTRMISILMRLLYHTPFHGLHQQPGSCRAELPIHHHLYRPRSKTNMFPDHCDYRPHDSDLEGTQMLQ